MMGFGFQSGASMNLQVDRTRITPTELDSETTARLWCPAEATEPVPGNARDDDLVEKLAYQLDQWLQANGCRLATTPLEPAAPAAPSAPITTHAPAHTASATATNTATATHIT